MDTDRPPARRTLYPSIEPYATGMLAVGEGHTLYFEECGRRDGVPVVSLHGGPGGGAASAMRRFFDPHRYRIILFDQRGCGRSTPHSELRANDTARLVADIERLREALGVETWLVFGGSWGSTLALAYGRAHPDRVLGFVLRGVFFCARYELDWFYRHGANALFPDAWARLVDRLEPAERDDVLAAYHKRLMVEPAQARQADAMAWSSWETGLISLRPEPGGELDARRADALARIETHYFVNGGFFERDGALLADAPRYTHLPAVIVQGRYDLVTPPRSAWALAKAWPRARLELVPDAGHAAGEPGTVDALVRATDAFAERLS